MRLSLKLSRAVTTAAWLIVVATLASCKDKEAPPTVASGLPSSSVAARGCPDGSSEDPPKAEFRAAISALRDKRYAEAQKLLRNLGEKYPRSATVRVWLGDAVLYDHARPYVDAADRALVHYKTAEDLLNQGCGLREPIHYYLRMGFAYAYLRKDDAEQAERHLAIAKKRWPGSAEVYYHSARAACLRKDHDACLKELEETFRLAVQHVRPLFLRVHRSLDDWFVRAETQSEFATLRRERASEFQALKEKYRRRAAEGAGEAER